MSNNNNSSFTSQIGFVLAAAGSAVGLGNIWRFPYFAAKDGGGIFLFIYLLVTLTFGFTMLTTEISIGRKTKSSTIKAFEKLKKEWKIVGYLGCIVPFIIFPYYCAIGGWVLKYLIAFICGNNIDAASPEYFSAFITSQSEPIIMAAIFIIITAFIVFLGVASGIEKSSRYMMPLLILIVLGIAIYAATFSYEDKNGLRTGIDGLKYCFIPQFDNLSGRQLLSIIFDAIGQSFYSISVAMGIMVTYGSYVHDNTDLIKSVDQIAFFDTLVAFLAAAMILPVVFVFNGAAGLSASGPGLIFVSLPVIFQQMGDIGRFIGILFFALVFFAALTSSVSILEAVVANFMETFQQERISAVFIETVLGFILAIIVCLGYNVFYFELPLPSGGTGQILDLMDFVSNNVLMPLTAIATCLLIGWKLSPEIITAEATKNGESFNRHTMYVITLKYIAPVILIILLLRTAGINII